VSVAAIVDAQGGTIRGARLAFGGLAHQPWRVPAAESVLVNAKASESAFAAAGDAVLQGAHGQGHNDFKIPLARRVLAGVLGEAARA
jgi:xanthine dehydrogenase YagS FAD-binding subunit